MSLNELSGPVIHIGVSTALALICRLNPVVTVFCGILPDLVDKPLALLGLGGGRYIGHTLIFAVLVSVAFSIWKRKYGLAALIGLASHLLLDLNGLVPWFYPFKDYDFYNEGFDIAGYIKHYLAFSQLGYEFIIAALVGVVAITCRFIYQRYGRQRKSR